MWIITGATGFIGSALAWELNQQGLEDLILVDHVSPIDRPKILRKRKFRDFVKAQDLFTYWQSPDIAKSIKGVFHMGACSNTTEMDEKYLQLNNVEYSQKVFQFCTEMKIPLIYASSGACYGDGKLSFDDQVDNRILRPLNPYGWSKVKMDIWASAQSHTPPHWYGLRFFNVYGPNEYHKNDQASVVFKAFNQIRDSGKLKLFKSLNANYTDGGQMRDFVYVKDITKWMRELMFEKSIESGIFNMGFGRPRTWLDLAQNVFINMEHKMQIEWIDLPESLRNQYQYFTQAKMDHFFAQGMSVPKWPLEEGINDYVRNHLRQQDPYL